MSFGNIVIFPDDDSRIHWAQILSCYPLLGQAADIDIFMFHSISTNNNISVWSEVRVSIIKQKSELILLVFSHGLVSIHDT